MKKTIFYNLTLALLIVVVSPVAISLGLEGVLPIANAGSSRYAAQEPVVLGCCYNSLRQTSKV